TTRTIPCSEAFGGSSERGCSSGSLWVAPDFEGTASPSWANERCGHPSDTNPVRIITQLRPPVMRERRDRKRDCPTCSRESVAEIMSRFAQVRKVLPLGSGWSSSAKLEVRKKRNGRRAGLL